MICNLLYTNVLIPKWVILLSFFTTTNYKIEGSTVMQKKAAVSYLRLMLTFRKLIS